MDRRVTIAILVLIAMFLIGWDVYVAWFNEEPDDTISEVILEFSSHPILPFGFGVLCGHFFWPQERRA